MFALKFFTHCFPHLLHFAFFFIWWKYCCMSYFSADSMICSAATREFCSGGKRQLSCCGLRMLQPEQVLWCIACLPHVPQVGSETATSPECSGDEHSLVLPRVELGQIFLEAGKRQGRYLYMSVQRVVGRTGFLPFFHLTKCRYLSHKVCRGQRPCRGHRSGQGSHSGPRAGG